MGICENIFYFVLIPGVLVGIITMITESPYFLIGGGITCVILWIIVGGDKNGCPVLSQSE